MTDQPKDDPQAIEEAKLDPSVKRCPKCGGRWLDCAAYPKDPRNATFVLYPPDADLLFNMGRFSAARALVCAHCGYTELYALYPERLKPKQQY